MIKSSFDIRTLANMDVALERVCKKTPRGEQHEAILEARSDIHIVFIDIQIPASMDGLKLAWLKFEIAGDTLDRPIYVDCDIWEKVVLNLLSSASKFTLTGGIRVALRPTPDGKAAELTVMDTGAGIPAYQIPRLFERFYQVGGQKGRSFEGSGMAPRWSGK